MDQSEGQKRAPRAESGAESIGPYAVIAPIAMGEATSVHLAQKHGALGFHRMAAIKRLRPSHASHPEWTQLLLDEARLGAGVHHANVVDIVDVGSEGGCYLVMEYIEGADLELLLQRSGRERHARYVVPPIVDALQGLQALHTAKDALGESLSMVHQAPRARHVLVGIDGTARIADLSQVSARGLIPSALRSERLKPPYLAPEQVLSPERVDARTDVFIMGITLWESLTGERLFQAEGPDLARRAVLERHVPKPSEVGLRPPRCFDAVCLKALQRKPELRYQSAAEMARALREAALDEALYASSSELGQWVRALVSRVLLERRHAIGADAPSIEIPLDALQGPSSSGAGPSGTQDVKPARAIAVSGGPTSSAGASGAVPLLNPAAPRGPRPDPAPIPSEPSRVARAMTVPVAAPPARAPASQPASHATLLGVSPRVGELPPRNALRGAPGAGTFQIAPERRAGATVPERSGSRAAPERSGQGSAAAGRSGRGQRNATITGFGVPGVPAGTPSYRQPEPAPAQRPFTRPPQPQPYAQPEPPPPHAPDGQPAGRRVRALRYDDASNDLRATRSGGDDARANRGAAIDGSDWDDAPSSGRGLGILSMVLVGIIVVAGVVGFKQWSEEGDAPARTQADEVPEPGPLRGAGEPTVEGIDRGDGLVETSEGLAGTAEEPAGKPDESVASGTGADEEAASRSSEDASERPSGAKAGAAEQGSAKAATAAPAARPEPPWKRSVPVAAAPRPAPRPVAPRPVPVPGQAAPRAAAAETPGLPSNPYE